MADTVKKPTKAEKENELLKQELEELKAQMALLMNQSVINSVSKAKTDRNITFISLTEGELVLRGSHAYTFKRQFEKRQFTEKEALIILNNMPQTIADGMVYIADAQFVADNDLTDAYRNILTDSQLKTLLNQDANYIIDTYQNCSESQQRIIIDMIIDKRQNEIEVDNNVLVKLSKLCGQDLMDIDPIEKDKK